MNGRLVRVDRAQRHVALHIPKAGKRAANRSIVLTDHVEVWPSAVAVAFVARAARAYCAIAIAQHA